MNHFSAIMDTPPARTSDLNWEQLHVPDVDLSSLDAPFTEQEIHAVISQLPSDKAPGLDGFTGLFFKTWETVKQDVIAALNSFQSLRCADLNLLNSASVVLIPKKDGAETVHDLQVPTDQPQTRFCENHQQNPGYQTGTLHG